MRRTTIAIAVSTVLAAGAAWTPASASCAPAPPLARALEDARTVFVGTVTELSNSERWATVDVEEVWKGDVEDVVEVRGGPPDGTGGSTTITSVDRYYRDGVTYLFVPYEGAGAIYRDNACTNTTRYQPALDRFRPTAHGGAEDAPPDGAAPGDAPTGDLSWAVVALGVALAAAAVVLLIRARR